MLERPLVAAASGKRTKKTPPLWDEHQALPGQAWLSPLILLQLERCCASFFISFKEYVLK